MEISDFRETVYSFYKTHKRFLPWRETEDQYSIFVSEIMLQQTQVDRVIPKYKVFLDTLPTFEKLSEAGLDTVLGLWQGLGYNRRAKYLKKCAETIVEKYKGCLPADYDLLLKLPGVGTYTASAIMAFVFRKPVTVIDTNIRRVYIYSFFSDEETIKDSQLIPFIEKTVDNDNPREWYYALMDYGAFLGRAEKGINHQSAHYKKQSAFRGSDRQIRGEIIRLLLASDILTFDDFLSSTGYENERLKKNLDSLVSENMITRDKSVYRIS